MERTNTVGYSFGRAGMMYLGKEDIKGILCIPKTESQSPFSSTQHWMLEDGINLVNQIREHLKQIQYQLKQSHMTSTIQFKINERTKKKKTAYTKKPIDGKNY